MAQNPNPSTLDAGQIVKRAFDESADRLRVDAEVTATIVGPQEVIISATDDSIRLADISGNNVGVTAGALNVNITGGSISGGNAAAGATGSAVPASADYTGFNNGGNLVGVSTSNPLPVAQQGNVAITAASLPLPTGASTGAKQDTGNTSLASIDGKTPALGQALAASSVPVVLTAAQVSTLTPLSSVTVTQATGTNLHTTVDNFPATQAISAVSLPLPTGAATSALQSTGNTSLASLDTKLPAQSSGRTPVETLPKTGSVQGTGTANNTPLVTIDSLGYSVAYIHIEQLSGTATGAGGSVQFLSSNDNINWNEQVVIIDVSPGSTPPPTGFRTREDNMFVSDGLGGFIFRGPFDYRVSFAQRYFQVNLLAAAPGNPTIRATVHYQAVPTIVPTVINTNTQIIDANNTPASFGPATMDASLSVVLATNQPAVPITGTFWQSTQPVSAATLPLPTLASTSTKQSDGSQKTQIVDGSGNVIASTTNALNVSAAQSGTWNVSNVSGTVSLPTGAATAARQDTGNTSLASIDSKITTGNTSLASIDGKITVVNTGAVVITSSALPSGASTSSLQTSGNASLTSIDGKTPALGQAAMAGSRPVTIASDQTAVPVSGTFFQSNQPVSVTSLPLPTNAAQETGGALAQNTLDNLVMKEALQEMILELRSIRFALVTLVTESGRNSPEDFDPNMQNFSTLNTLN